MCGIVGVLRFGTEPAVPSYNMSALYLATNLLESSESRGGDATGVTALFDDGNFFMQKMAIGAAEFVARAGGKPDDFEGLLELLREYNKSCLRCFIGHCRKKSAGALDNVDNHPIKSGNIIGVHNGTLKNDKEIFENLGCERDGKVDSEAIFKLLQHYTNNSVDPFTVDSVKETCFRLEGTYSFLAINTNNPYQVVSAKDGRPAEYCIVKPLGLVLIASDKKFIERALWSYSKMARLFPTGNPDTEFISLKKDDIEFASLPNDTLAIFDLTKEITEETKLEELYVTEKTPLQVKPEWKSVITTTYGAGYGNTCGYHGNNYANGYSGGKATTEEKKTTKTDSVGKNTHKSSNTTKVIARVWNKKLDVFVNRFGRQALVDKGAVVDVENDTITSLADTVTTALLDKMDADEAKKSLPSKDVDNVDELVNLTEITTPVEIYTVNSVIPVENIIKSDNGAENHEVQTKEVAVKTIKNSINNAKESLVDKKRALDEAILAAKTIEKFSDDFELATFINLDVASLNQLPPASLANRIIKNLFSKFFVAGWEAKNETISYKNGTDEEKLAKAMKHIRVLKSFGTNLDEIVDVFRKSESADLAKYTKSLIELLTSKSEMSKSTLSEIFNSGDFRSSSVLKNIMAGMD